MSDWSHGAEKCCIRWKSALANFFGQGTQELEAPAITALQEMRKWTHNPHANCKSTMESVILHSGLGLEILWIANPQVDQVLPPRIETGWSTSANTQEFLQLLSQHLFAFSSERCFLAEAVRWMLLTLAAKAPSVTWIYKASLNQLFCLICGFSNANLDALYLDEELLLVLKSSAKLRGLHKELAKGFHEKFHKNGVAVHTDYIPLMDLGLRKISRCADILACCGQDVTLLVDASSPNTVLVGVSFDTFSYEDLQKIHYESSAGKETKAIKWGSQFC
ncbi:uncharacterized protein BJ212DRAFT_1302788 [Suillus subaureus]|uniref:Uncharacterized protein n=1 Tax=Suillus subaureus TaxID=48587 RepID=A0A9P7J8Y9_9AGAM|nr:uncharacterized protein BJ212DRAFT_1302788 [Suillus subaureus]KAG1808887.1 hypothetical protein BJ212DRAFT_1302788 [Suillus subaureus]